MLPKYVITTLPIQSDRDPTREYKTCLCSVQNAVRILNELSVIKLRIYMIKSKEWNQYQSFILIPFF